MGRTRAADGGGIRWFRVDRRRTYHGSATIGQRVRECVYGSVRYGRGILRAPSLGLEGGVGGGEVIVSVPRSRVELRNLQLPKAERDELPDMVRFAAMRQFTSVGDTWPIDFCSVAIA